MKDELKKEQAEFAERRGKQKRRIMLAVLLCLLVAGTFLVNVIVYRLGQRYTLSADLTANAAYEVGKETRALLSAGSDPIEFLVLAKPNAYGGSPYFLQMQHIMEEYPKISARVKLSYIDYASDPSFASKYPDLVLQQGDILILCGERVKQLHFSEMFNYSYTDSGDLTIVSCRAEEALASAIVSVTTNNQLRVAVLAGNGVVEMKPFTELLTANNFTVSTVNIATDPLDDSYDIALLLAPQVDLPEDALKKINDFLYNGGNYGKLLFYAADVQQTPMPNLNTLFNEWGIRVGDGAVFETSANRTYQNQPFYPVTDYVSTDYTKSLVDSSMPFLMPLSRPIEQLFTNKGTITNTVLLQFGKTSGVRPSDAPSNFTPDMATLRGPLPALILSSKNIYDAQGKLKGRSSVLVSASTSMLDSYCIQNTSLSNSKYLLNLLNKTFDRSGGIAIEPKSLAGQTLSLTSAQATRIGVILAAVVPLLILLAGIGIWLVRRYK